MGRRSRIESLDGQVLFVSDGTVAWDFTSDPQQPRCTELRRVHCPGAGRHLVLTPPVTHWVGHHHARPTGPVTDLTFLGRNCWSVDLAPRERRELTESSLRLIVDADTGAVLAQHSGDGVDGAAYTDLTVGECLDPSLFSWDGPVVTDEQSRARAGHGGPSATRWEEAMQWFRDTVTAEPIEVPVLMDLTPRLVDRTDPHSDAFTAPLGTDQRAGFLIRRPRSNTPWAVKTHGFQIAWSTRDFDWACHLSRGVLDVAGTVALQQCLHPGEPVVGTPRLVFGGSDGP